MSARRAVYLWTGYWSFDRTYLAEEPLDLPNIVLASSMTLLGICGLAIAWRHQRMEALRYGGVLFFYPILYYFTHPEAYRMRPLDPLLVILGCHAVLSLRIARQKHSYPQPASEVTLQPAD